MVFAVVGTHFPRKTPACLVDRTAINKQQFTCNNEHPDWSGSLAFGQSGVQLHKGGEFFFSFFFFLFALFFFLVITLKNK